MVSVLVGAPIAFSSLIVDRESCNPPIACLRSRQKARYTSGAAMPQESKKMSNLAKRDFVTSRGLGWTGIVVSGADRNDGIDSLLSVCRFRSHGDHLL